MTQLKLYRPVNCALILNNLFNWYGLIYINVSADLDVTILSNGTSQVGTPRQLVCQTDSSSSNLVGALTYQWTSTCPGQCFVLGHANEAVVSTQYLKAVDAGIHTCTVTDSVGNRGNASIEIVTTGKQILYNNNTGRFIMCSYT